MARGPKKHMKRITAPRSWMMNKMGGVYTVRPAQGPHKRRESLPLQIVLRDKLGLAFNGTECYKILKQKEGLVRVDQKIRREPKYPVGLMDVIELPKCGLAYRVFYDVKGRFKLLPLDKKSNEQNYKICRIVKKSVANNKIGYLVSHDGRTLRYVDGAVMVHDSVKLNLSTNEIEDHIPLQNGNKALISHGNNRGRIGIIHQIKKFPGSYDLVTLKDARGTTFTTRIDYVMPIGVGNKSFLTLPEGEGVKKTIIEIRDERLAEEEDL
jgi:small subunit ribosomal protein S4e